MNEDLRNKLTGDLEKSGFGSEMRAIKVFLDKGWRCSGGYYYFDEDEEKNKEADLVASRTMHEELSGEKHVSVEYEIVAEVKKSEKPWVVFKKNFVYEGFESLDAWNNLTYHVNLPCEPYHLTESLSESSLLGILKWKGYSIHESFKRPEAPSRWYSAFLSASKAAESVLSSSRRSFELPNWHELLLVKPVVIVDGVLVSASLSKEGDLLLEEAKFAPFEFFHKSKSATKNTYRIDVVRLDHLEEYIDISEARLKKIYYSLKSFV